MTKLRTKSRGSNFFIWYDLHRRRERKI